LQRWVKNGCYRRAILAAASLQWADIWGPQIFVEYLPRARDRQTHLSIPAPGISCPSYPGQQPGHYLLMRIANGRDSLDDLVSKDISLFFRLALVLRKRHPFADDFTSLLVFRIHFTSFLAWSSFHMLAYTRLTNQNTACRQCTISRFFRQTAVWFPMDLTKLTCSGELPAISIESLEVPKAVF